MQSPIADRHKMLICSHPRAASKCPPPSNNLVFRCPPSARLNRIGRLLVPLPLLNEQWKSTFTSFTRE